MCASFPRRVGPSGIVVAMATTIPKHPLVALARKQNRMVARRQLLALGLTQAAIRHLLESGRLHRVHPGVYAVGTPPATPIERATAAVLACGDQALLSHESALALWGLAPRWPRCMHVTTPADRRPSGIVVHQSRTLTRADARNHLGVRTTSPARTLHDCAPALSHRALTRAVNDALRSPFMSRAQLEEMSQRGKRLLQFTVVPTNPTRSDMEDLFLAFCKRFGFPRPLVNTHVIGYEVDALFADQRVIVELDSWRFHGDRAAFQTDRKRDRDLLAAGYVTVRITWERLTETAAAEAVALGTILANRGWPQPARSAPAS